MAIKIKKILLWTGITIIMAVLSFYGYIKYQQSQSYQTLIHKNAGALVKVDVYALYQSMLPEYFGRKKRQRKPMFEGVVLPANIFLFSVKDKQRTTLFTSFQLDNAQAFSASLKKQKQLVAALTMADGTSISQSVDKVWTIAHDEHKVVISFSANKEKVEDVLLDMLKGKNTMEVERSPFKEIAQQQAHICYLSKSDKGSLQFNKGSIALQAILMNRGLMVGERTSHQQLNKDNALQLWFYADMQSWLAGKSLWVDSILISGDSLLAAQPKGIELRLGKSVTQKDSVVTYEYNDDFEKVAQVSIKETKVPGLSLQVHAQPDRLLSYLQRLKIVHADSGLVNKDIFPLYQLYTSKGDGYLQAGTLRGYSPNNALQTTNEFFGLQIVFPLLQQQEELLLLKKYLVTFEALNIKATKTDNQFLKVDGILQFKNKEKQALWQLLELI